MVSSIEVQREETSPSPEGKPLIFSRLPTGLLTFSLLSICRSIHVQVWWVQKGKNGICDKCKLLSAFWTMIFKGEIFLIHKGLSHTRARPTWKQWFEGILGSLNHTSLGLQSASLWIPSAKQDMTKDAEWSRCLVKGDHSYPDDNVSPPHRRDDVES